MTLAPLSTIAVCALLAAAAARAQPLAGRAPAALLLQGLGSSIGVTLRDSAAGAVVHAIRADSPAAAQLQPGDLVIELDGTPLRNGRQLLWMIRDTPPGRRLEIVVIRDSATLRVTLMPVASGSLAEQDRLLGETRP